MDNERKILTLSQAASILGVHADTLRRWDREGSLVALRTAGGHRRYNRSDIINFLDQKKVDLENDTGMVDIILDIPESLIESIDAYCSENNMDRDQFVDQALRSYIKEANGEQESSSSINEVSVMLDFVKKERSSS